MRIQHARLLLRVYLTIIVLLLPFSSISQQVKNVRFEQIGKKIHIYYDLQGEGSYYVNVFCSTDDGHSWGNPLQNVVGAVGENQTPGNNKEIIWNVLDERGKLVGYIRFKIDVVQEVSKQVYDNQDVYVVVESMPTFPGGMGALMKYLAENIRYPQRAIVAGIQGRVFVNFIVEPDGSITNAKVLRGIGAGCDEEAMRVVQNMPNWIPGKQRGKPVRVSYNLPVKFMLETQKE
jgi:protein TonB